MATLASTGMIVQEHKALTEIVDDFDASLRKLTGKSPKDNLWDIQRDNRPSVKRLLEMYEKAEAELKAYSAKNWHSQ
jgi:adenylate kinase family enzyme